MLTSELMAVGIAPTPARVMGSDPLTVVPAAGTTQATATLLASDAANVSTVPLNSGVRLPSSSPTQTGIVFILNSGSNVLSIYPATGEKINAAAANAAITLAPGKIALIWALGNQWLALISA